jgi:hypothetical protein
MSIADLRSLATYHILQGEKLGQAGQLVTGKFGDDFRANAAWHAQKGIKLAEMADSLEASARLLKNLQIQP